MDKEFLKYLRTQQKKHGVTWEDKSYRDQKIEMEHKKGNTSFPATDSDIDSLWGAGAVQHGMNYDAKKKKNK